MRISAALGWYGFAALVGSASAFKCMTDVDLGPASHAAKKGIAVDDSTLQWCATQIPEEWPNAEQPMTSIRLFKAWDALWGEAGREAAWNSLVAYAQRMGAKVLIGTQITCNEAEDVQAWSWTKELLQKLHPEHVMGLAIGNELELLQFKGEDLVPEECVTRIWEEGYYWRQFRHIVSEFDALGFGSVPVTGVFTGLGLAGDPFYELPGKARVNSFVSNATSEYGNRFAFTFNFYPYFDPNMHLDAGTSDQCEGALAVAGCWGPDCVVPGQIRQARLKMQQTTGSSEGTLWIGETGWSSPLSGSLETRMKPCEAWSSMETFRRFYQGFLEWDLEIGGGQPAPDHIFWFTMRDAWNFGLGEHFGLISTCDEPKCKVSTADYVPARFTLISEKEKQTTCGDEALYNGWVYGEIGCKNKCVMDMSCMFYSEWAESHDGLRWCRHTRTCDVLESSDYLVSIHERQVGVETTTEEASTTAVFTTEGSTTESSTTTTLTTSTGEASTTETSTTATSTASTTETSTTEVLTTASSTTTTFSTTSEASTTETSTTATTTASASEASTTEVLATESSTTTTFTTSTSEAATSETSTTATSTASAGEASTTEVSTTEGSTTESSTTTTVTMSTGEASTTETSTTATWTASAGDASTTEVSTTEVLTTESPTTTTVTTSTSEAATSETSTTTMTATASAGEASTTEASTTEISTTESLSTTPPVSSTLQASTTQTFTTTASTSSTSEASTTETSTTEVSTTEFSATTAEATTSEASATETSTIRASTTATEEASTTEASTTELFATESSTTAAAATSTSDAVTSKTSTTTAPTTSARETSTTEASVPEAPTTTSQTTLAPEPKTSTTLQSTPLPGETSTTAPSVVSTSSSVSPSPASTTVPPLTSPSSTSVSLTSTVPSSTWSAISTSPSSTSAEQQTTTASLLGACEFENEPVVPGYFWDPTCKVGMLGCNADGKNIACRLCGADAYSSIPCPPSSCHFPNEPAVPYYWDETCETGKQGCWADGIHAECRFCGEHPFTSIPCPHVVATPPSTACDFANEPGTPYFWDPECTEGMHGCLADGLHIGCRFCGEGRYKNVSCPSGPASEACTFANEPSVPYFWDKDCRSGMIGCLADGIHTQCRFCDVRPFQDVPCPSSVAPPKKSCAFPEGAEPQTPYYWDEACAMGLLGCWADGLHAQCRFCGRGVFRNVPCPESSAPGQRSAPPADTADPASEDGSPPDSAFRQDASDAGPAQDIAPEEASPEEDEEAPLSGTRCGVSGFGIVIVPAWLMMLWTLSFPRIA